MEPASILVRLVEIEDYDGLKSCTSDLGHGFTSFPQDDKFLKNKLKRATDTIKDIDAVPEPLFFLVMEDVATKAIIGFCGIEANVGEITPFYNYKVNTICQTSEQLQKQVTHRLLQVTNDFKGVSELVSLYLAPGFRGEKRGECLSRSRFILMGLESNRFCEIIIAEIRGVSDEAGVSPFWDCVGKKFFPLDFTEADYMSAITNKQFISDLLPREPIYTSLLNEDAREVIGLPHRQSAKAKKMLEAEGFNYTSYVDIFDAGPVMVAKKTDIKTIQQTVQAVVSGINDTHSSLAMVGTIKHGFKLTAGNVYLNDNMNVEIDSATAQLLDIKIGDSVYVDYLD